MTKRENSTREVMEAVEKMTGLEEAFLITLHDVDDSIHARRQLEIESAMWASRAPCDFEDTLHASAMWGAGKNDALHPCS